MTTPAETIPVANAVPVAPTTPMERPSASEVSKNDFFQQPISSTQYFGRFLQIYVGHLDTFLTITFLASLPAIVGYQWMLTGYWGSSTMFHWVLLPFTRLVADGAAIIATALIYLLGADHKIPWKTALTIACSKKVFGRWILQSLMNHLQWILAPLGVFAFSAQLLLLEQESTVVGSMMRSGTLVFRRPGTIFATIFFTYGLKPFLCWVLEKVVNICFPLFVSTNSSEGEEEMEEDPWAQGRQEVHEIIALPLTSCLWTILYLNICIQRKPELTREALAQEIGVQLPPVARPSMVARDGVH